MEMKYCHHNVLLITKAFLRLWAIILPFKLFKYLVWLLRKVVLKIAMKVPNLGCLAKVRNLGLPTGGTQVPAELGIEH